MKDIFNIKGAIAKERLNDLWSAYEEGTLVKENFTIFALCEYQRGVSKEGHVVFFSKHHKELEKYNEAMKKILPDDLYETFREAYTSFGSPEGATVCAGADEIFRAYDEVITEILKDYACKRKLI